MPQPKQAISISPILALFEIVQAEYERAVTSNWTGVLGLGYWSIGDGNDNVSWLATDLKARFYPAATPLEGFSIGGIVGLTTINYTTETTAEDASATGLTLGVDLNHSWLLGDTNRWYVGIGLGAKRYFFDVEDQDIMAILPTGRLAFGIAF